MELAAVVALVRRRIDEPVVGAEVDDSRRLGQLVGERTRRAVRQGEEDEIGVMEQARRGLGEDEVGDRPQVGVHLADALTGVAVRRDHHDVEVRMPGDEAQQLATGVSAGTGYRDAHSHPDNYARGCNFMQPGVRPRLPGRQATGPWRCTERRSPGRVSPARRSRRAA